MMKAKDIRILWSTDKEGKISDLIVEEFLEKHLTDEQRSLYERYSFDIGNCWVDWEHDPFKNLLSEIGRITILYGFANDAVILKALREFRKIDELREIIDLIFAGGIANNY